LINCQDVTEKATAYMEGDMTLLQKASFLLHVGFCVHCLRYLRQLRQAVRELANLPADPPAPEVTEDLVAMFRAEQSGS
jgi:hypothetical protein